MILEGICIFSVGLGDFCSDSIVWTGLVFEKIFFESFKKLDFSSFCKRLATKAMEEIIISLFAFSAHVMLSDAAAEDPGKKSQSR